MRILAPVMVGLTALCAAPAIAATPETEAFGQCLIGKTTGDDRLLLARWITLSFSSHYIVADVVTVDQSKLADLDQKMAALVMSLLVERCSAEAKAAVVAEGNPATAMQKAFEMLGMVASQEVMMDANVQARINAFGGFLDESKLAAVLSK
ncbi:MAG: hypothetical protein U1E58_11060 [Tabrizicola sp.]